MKIDTFVELFGFDELDTRSICKPMNCPPTPKAMGFITEEQIEGLEKIEEKYSLGIDIEEIENLLIENPYPDTLNKIYEKICEDNVSNEVFVRERSFANG